MTSRPAAPVKMGSLDDALKYAEFLEAERDRLAAALSLAQTEIKGHMRVEDDLKVRIAELEKALVNSADSFKDVARCLRMLGHPISASACEVAEEGARDALKSRA